MEARMLREGLLTGVTNHEGYEQALVRKWSAFPTPNGTINMLEGLQGRIGAVVAHVLENQAKALSEDTLSTNVGLYTKWALPMVRRLFSNLILPQVGTIQPVDSPNGIIRILMQKYDNTKGTKIPFGAITNQPYAMGYEGALTAGDEAVKNFAKEYSNEHIDYFKACSDTGAGTATLNNTLTNCQLLTRQFGPIRAPGTAGQRTFLVRARYRVIDAGFENMIATLASTGTALLDQYGNTVGACDVTTGTWTINALTHLGAPTVFETSTVIYFEYYVNSELVRSVTGAQIPTISFDVQTLNTQAEPWTLGARWTLNAELAMRDQNGFDLEAEIVKFMTNEISLEIDRMGIQMMIDNAASTASASYTASYPGKLDNISNIIHYMDLLGASISNKSHRGGANFAVMHDTVWAHLQQLGNHRDWSGSVSIVTPETHGVYNADYGIKFAGTMNGMKIFVNPYQDATKILVGYKGESWLDAGFCYAPWVPITVVDTLTTPLTLSREKAIVSYGSMRVVRPENFGVLTYTGVPAVTFVSP